MEKGVSKLCQDSPLFNGCGGVKMFLCYRKVLIAQWLRDPNKTCHLTPGALFACQTWFGRAGGVLCPGLILHVVLTAVNVLFISLPPFLLYLSYYLENVALKAKLLSYRGGWLVIRGHDSGSLVPSPSWGLGWQQDHRSAGRCDGTYVERSKRRVSGKRTFHCSSWSHRPIQNLHLWKTQDFCTTETRVNHKLKTSPVPRVPLTPWHINYSFEIFCPCGFVLLKIELLEDIHI